MSLLRQAIPNLVNGVSQQPAILRLASQAEEQINFASSVAEGLVKRPGTRLARRLVNLPLGAATPFTHAIERDSEEKYLVVITDGDIDVYDLNGERQTVSFPDGKDYLIGVEPNDTFRAATIADFTFIVNNTVKVRTLNDVIPDPAQEALIWVKQADIAARYEILIDGDTKAEYLTDNDNAEGGISTIVIANALKTGSAPTGISSSNLDNTLNPTDWFIRRRGSTIYIQRTDGGTFAISVVDSHSNQNIAAIKNTVQSFTDLPQVARDGFYVRVEGDVKADEDDYYVVYDKINNNETWRGVWKETLKRNQEYKLNASTMPHVLVRESDGTFTFRQATWEDRKVGDLGSNPFPSFENRRINDIFFHRNRLGVITDENVVFSKAGSYYDFFRDTVTQVLDSDPIDVAISSNKVHTLRHAVPFDRTVVFLSNTAQFMLADTDLLTPNTIAINQTTAFEVHPNVAPAQVGKFLYFGAERTTGSLIREYFVDETSETEDANDITNHVPTYVPPGLGRLVSSPNDNVIVAFSEDEPNKLFIYRYYWSGNEKLQSSWSTYEFPYVDRIIGALFYGSLLAIVTSTGTEEYLEILDFASGQVGEDIDFPIHLDRRIHSSEMNSISYSAGTNITTITWLDRELLVGDETDVVVVAGPSSPDYQVGEEVPFTIANADRLELEGNVPNFWVGRRIVSTYVFSTFYPKDNQDSGRVSIGTGRLQLRNMTVSLAPSMAFEVRVTPEYRSTAIHQWRVYTSPAAEPAPKTGRYRFAIMTKNLNTEITLYSDSPLPCGFTGAEWEGIFVNRSRRLG